MQTIFIKTIDALWRGILVGLTYTITLMIGGLLVKMVGLSIPVAKDAPATLLWSIAGGTIMGLFLGPIAKSISISRLRHNLVWSSVILFNLVSVTVEGYYFAPILIGNSLTGLILQQILTAFITGWVITVLFTSNEISASITLPARSFISWSWRFAVGALSYLVFYFLFGALNFALVTGPYYEARTGGLVTPVLGTILMAELIRSVLIVFSILPFLLTIQTDKKRLILLSGLILFAIGGLVPLTMQVGTLPLILLAASAVEIFFQNFSTGAVAAFLLGQSV